MATPSHKTSPRWILSCGSFCSGSSWNGSMNAPFQAPRHDVLMTLVLARPNPVNLRLEWVASQPHFATVRVGGGCSGMLPICEFERTFRPSGCHSPKHDVTGCFRKGTVAMGKSRLRYALLVMAPFLTSRVKPKCGILRFQQSIALRRPCATTVW